uniref:EF-hand domain-containing protein n=1 Tax=Macrostomum lignano TaxID=282301 RepID=A0A1I8HJX8_9PLAT
MAVQEHGVETALGKFQNSAESDELEAASSADDVDDARETPKPPNVDAATREAWMSAFRTVSRRRGVGLAVGQLGDALRLAGFVVTEAEVAQYRAEADPGGTGRIGADAFVALAAKARLELGSGEDGEASADSDFKRLRAALAVFDKQSTGRINAGDLRHWLTSLGEPIDEADVNRMLEHLVDDRGLLDCAELAHRLVGP